MKTLFIPAKLKNLNINLSKKEISKLPKKLLLLYTIQYQGLAEQIKKQLEADNIIISGPEQVLGCSKINTKLPLLLISTGDFHARNLYLQSPIIYMLKNNKIIKIPKSEINKLKTQKKTALIKFLNAEKIGILVSTKPGQNNLNLALKLKEKLQKRYKSQKQVFIFISDNIDINQFENFQIDSWVNTACPGIAVDKPAIINYDELPSS